MLLESITDGCFALDRHWCFIYVNGAAEKMMGSSREDLLGKNHWDAFPDAVGTLGEQSYRRAVREQVAVEFDLHYDPWQRWFSLKAYPTKEGGLCVLFRDITAQQKSVEEQRQQWRTFDALLSNTPDHAYILDPTGRFLYANAAVLTFWQTSLDKLLHQKVHELELPAAIAAKLKGDVEQVVATGQRACHEVAFLDLTGEYRCYEYIFSPIVAVDGAVEAIAGSSRDITERDRAARLLIERSRVNALGADVGKALTQTEDLSIALQRCAQALVQHLDAAFARIWTLPPGATVLELQASSGLYTHLDGPHARIPVGAFKIGLIAQERRPHITNDIAEDKRISDPAWARNEGLIAFAGYPLIVEDRLVGVFALFARRPLGQDILDALASVADSIAIGIERKRAERTLAAQTEQLARSNEDLQQFAYITSHDLQEPLRTMGSFSQILLRRFDGQLDSQASEFLSYIVSGAQRMQGLMDSLLNYSRAVSVESSLLEPVALETALQWAIANLHTAILESEAVVTHDPLPTIPGDQLLLVQLLQNLIANGIKYRKPAALPRIHVSAAQDNGFCILAVRDNGIGIEAENQERIFAAFKRLHGREIPGAGMGLAICKRIVERHTGRIWVESTPGEGSSFFVALPSIPSLDIGTPVT